MCELGIQSSKEVPGAWREVWFFPFYPIPKCLWLLRGSGLGNCRLRVAVAVAGRGRHFLQQTKWGQQGASSVYPAQSTLRRTFGSLREPSPPSPCPTPPPLCAAPSPSPTGRRPSPGGCLWPLGSLSPRDSADSGQTMVFPISLGIRSRPYPAVFFY